MQCIGDGKMKNLKIYITTLLGSLLLFVPSLLCGSSYSNLRPLYDVFSGIGCSGIAAAVMAIFLEYSSTRREQEKLKQAKSLYFRQIYDQLIMTIERILWFNERLQDASFNWNLHDSDYSTFHYMTGIGSLYPQTSLPYDDAINKLKEIGVKYNIDKIKIIAESDKYKIMRMFKIVSASCSYLLNEAITIKNNKLILGVEEYMSLDENSGVMFDISFFVGLMSNPYKNYQAAIDSLINVTERIRKLGQYPKGDIRVGLHGSFSVSEL